MQTKLNVNVNDFMKKNEALNNFCLQSHVQPYPPKCRGPTEKECIILTWHEQALLMNMVLTNS